MEREERRRPARRKRRNGAMLAVIVVLLVFGIGELVVLVKQRKEIRELTGTPGEVQAQLAVAHEEAAALRAQVESTQAERDAYLVQIEQLTAGAVPADPAVTVDVPVEEPTAGSPVETVEPDGSEAGGDPGTEDTQAGYTIEENVKRIYEDIRYQQFAKENDPYDTKQYTFATMYSYPTDVVFLGDSLTERCSWNELFPDLNVKNRGIGGDTVNGVLVRLDTVMKTQPKKIFLMVGVNNLMNNNSVDQIIEDYGVLLDKLVKIRDEDGVKIYVESILPAGPELKDASRIILDGREVNKAVKSMCEERVITYIDLTDPFSNADLALNSEYDYDGVHINAKGYRALRDILDDYVYEGFGEENNEVSE